MRIDLIEHHVPRLECDDLVRSCADRLEVIRRVAGLLPCVLGKEVFGEDVAPPG